MYTTNGGIVGTRHVTSTTHVSIAADISSVLKLATTVVEPDLPTTYHLCNFAEIFFTTYGVYNEKINGRCSIDVN
jgi:hypothetical protein